MNQEILHLRQEVTTLTAAPRTTLEVEEQIATIQTTIEETTHWSNPRNFLESYTRQDIVFYSETH